MCFGKYVVYFEKVSGDCRGTETVGDVTDNFFNEER
jgi:hypothetical protein